MFLAAPSSPGTLLSMLVFCWSKGCLQSSVHLISRKRSLQGKTSWDLKIFNTCLSSPEVITLEALILGNTVPGRQHESVRLTLGLIWDCAELGVRQASGAPDNLRGHRPRSTLQQEGTTANVLAKKKDQAFKRVFACSI